MMGLGLSMDDYLGYLNRTEEEMKAEIARVLRPVFALP